MELGLKKACFDAYEAAGELTLTQEETAETIVPDYCPDIARIIETTGKVFLHSREMRDGRAEISGTVRVTVLYTPENESGVRALEFAMPFSAQGEGLAGCAHVVVETEIELLESRMLNPRKIFTRCKLVTHLAGCRKVCLTISSDAETDPALLVEKPSDVLAYDPSLTFTTAPWLSVARANVKGASAGNYALFAGGRADGFCTTVDAYNASLTRTTATALSSTKNNSAAATVGNHAIFVGNTASADIYDASLTKTSAAILRTSLATGRRSETTPSFQEVEWQISATHL